MNDALGFIGFLALLAAIVGGFIGIALSVGHLVMIGLSTIV
jgi:hypothetical protein